MKSQISVNIFPASVTNMNLFITFCIQNRRVSAAAAVPTLCEYEFIPEMNHAAVLAGLQESLRHVITPAGPVQGETWRSLARRRSLWIQLLLTDSSHL